MRSKYLRFFAIPLKDAEPGLKDATTSFVLLSTKYLSGGSEYSGGFKKYRFSILLGCTKSGTAARPTLYSSNNSISSVSPKSNREPINAGLIWASKSDL